MWLKSLVVIGEVGPGTWAAEIGQTISAASLIGVAIRLADRRTDLPSAIVRALPGGRDDLPSQALATANGGQVWDTSGVPVDYTFKVQ